ncbi:MAG: PAS domain S-box protein [Chloroflexi bacterium]|nr:PAS domain S-box protein [Chloroflexota bacterium]
MDEKTIPLSKYDFNRRTPVKEAGAWLGKDLNYRTLFDQTSECVFIIGFDLRYLAANSQASRLLGYDESELVGMPVSAVMSLDEDLTHASILGEGSNLYERILRRKDGSTLPVEISASIVYDERNSPVYIQSVARDISERKNAEQKLKRQAIILSLISDATARLLASSNIEMGIPEFLQLLGRVMGSFFCAIINLDVFSSSPSISIEYQWLQKNRQGLDPSLWFSAHATMIVNKKGGYFEGAEQGLVFMGVPISVAGGVPKYLVLLENAEQVTWSEAELQAMTASANLIGAALQRNVYEEALRVSEARNRVMLSALPDLLIRIDAHGTILDYLANPNHPLFIHRDMIAGKRLSEIWPEDIARQVIGERVGAEFDAATPACRFFLPFNPNEYESRLYPINDNREALLMIRDVTEQAQLEQMKSDFINRASHELRTPLTSAILMTELIQEGGSAEEMSEYWRTLQSELNRQKILIDRLLIAGRLESGMMTLERVPLDLSTVLAESAQAVMPIAHKKKVKVQFNRPIGRPNVLGDKSALEQVFINLLNNAIKFSPEGRSVILDVDETAQNVSVNIIDQGLGIPANAIPHLFDRFYRASNVTIAEIPGSGIGLYIVKNILEELGGRIEVSSVPNQGSIFTVVLQKAL